MHRHPSRVAAIDPRRARRPRLRPTNRWLIICACVAGGWLTSFGVVDAAAQSSPLIVEARAGVSSPLFSFRDGTRSGEGVEAGPSFSVDMAVARGSRQSITVGFSQHRFVCDEAGCSNNDRYVATGVNLGMRVNLRTTGEVVPWVRLAGRSVRVELPARGDIPPGTSDLGFGGELGMGLYLGAFGAVAFNPGIRLVATNTRLPGGPILRLRHWVADLGLALAF